MDYFKISMRKSYERRRCHSHSSQWCGEKHLVFQIAKT